MTESYPHSPEETFGSSETKRSKISRALTRIAGFGGRPAKRPLEGMRANPDSYPLGMGDGMDPAQRIAALAPIHSGPQPWASEIEKTPKSFDPEDELI